MIRSFSNYIESRLTQPSQRALCTHMQMRTTSTVMITFTIKTLSLRHQTRRVERKERETVTGREKFFFLFNNVPPCASSRSLIEINHQRQFSELRFPFFPFLSNSAALTATQWGTEQKKENYGNHLTFSTENEGH